MCHVGTYSKTGPSSSTYIVPYKRLKIENSVHGSERVALWGVNSSILRKINVDTSKIISVSEDQVVAIVDE